MFEAVVAAYLRGAQASGMGAVLQEQAYRLDDLAALVQRDAHELAARMTAFADRVTGEGGYVAVTGGTPVTSSAAQELELNLAKLHTLRAVFLDTWQAWSGETFRVTRERVAAAAAVAS